MGSLGVLYDNDYEGDGIRIAEVLKGGVLYIADPEISAGDVITAINGVEIKAGDNWFDHLRQQAGKKMQVTIKKKGRKAE